MYEWLGIVADEIMKNEYTTKPLIPSAPSAPPFPDHIAYLPDPSQHPVYRTNTRPHLPAKLGPTHAILRRRLSLYMWLLQCYEQEANQSPNLIRHVLQCRQILDGARTFLRIRYDAQILALWSPDPSRGACWLPGGGADDRGDEARCEGDQENETHRGYSGGGREGHGIVFQVNLLWSASNLPKFFF